MERLWEWYEEWGVMTEASYPYVSGTNGGYETTCQYDENAVTFPVTGQGSANSPQEILDVLQERPLTIAIAAGYDFNWYSGGVIDSSDTSHCASSLNHAMVLVGYTAGDEGSQTEITSQ